MTSASIVSTFRVLGQMVMGRITQERARCKCGEYSTVNLPKSTIRRKNEKGVPIVVLVFWCEKCRAYFRDEKPI